MNEDDRHESWVGHGSTPNFSGEPRDVAEAKVILMRARSRTMAGLHDMVLESHRVIVDVGKQYQKDGRAYLQDLKAVGSVCADLLENSGKMLKQYELFAQEMRKPVQPRPTGAEVAVDGLKHIASEIRALLERTLSGHPDLQRELARHLSKLVQRGSEVLGHEPAPSAAMAPAAAEKQAPSMAADVETLEALRFLGEDWVQEFLKSQRIDSFGAITARHYEAIREAARAKKESAK